MAEKDNTKRNRREEILQALAQMLESSDGSQRITTAKLAANVRVSEAPLYRYFTVKYKQGIRIILLLGVIKHAQ
jgi:TetR/AcrR family transcriptional regulator